MESAATVLQRVGLLMVYQTDYLVGLLKGEDPKTYAEYQDFLRNSDSDTVPNETPSMKMSMRTPQSTPSNVMDFPSAFPMQALPISSLQPPQRTAPQQMPQILAGPSNPSPHGQIGDVANQMYVNSQQAAQQQNFAQKILAMRFQPTPDDEMQAYQQNTASLYAPNTFKGTTSQDIAQNRAQLELAPYTTASKFMENSVQAGGGATGALVNRLMAADPTLSFPSALYQVQTGYRQGLQMGPGGVVAPIQGAPSAMGQIKYGETAGGEQAKLQYAGPIAGATETGKQLGETTSDLNAAQSAMPQLEQAVNKLSELGKRATYSIPGQAVNALARQSGFGSTPGGIARAEYIAHVKNNVLPLLRRTFGAQFTKAEGDSLLATMGDPNSTPEEKDATLRAFIQDKRATLATMQRQVGGGLTPPADGASLPDVGPSPVDPLGIR